eukprot:gnl/Dysnectes_brevis/4235_a5604_620.p1 GENE.gnl/Dysnectes_brevis/4235_a5604_620~~gnl/Dysnectes_brevis/4235_a5604_620.p1  ORF type:complete len:1097 (+),score=185.19 gnl/Dysnectes_brevis/4235_a5604_620:48-3293(+)
MAELNQEHVPEDVDKQTRHLRVACRLRPGGSESSSLKFSCQPQRSSIMIRGGGKEATYSLDHVFDSHSTNRDIFDSLLPPLIERVLDGYQGLAFAYGQTNSGKCLARDTPVLMSNGSFKPVQDIGVGEQLMGDDNTVRTVLTTTTGREEMARITLSSGASFVCNMSHILSLVLINHTVYSTSDNTVVYHYVSRNHSGEVTSITRVNCSCKDEDSIESSIMIDSHNRHHGHDASGNVIHDDTVIDISVRDFLELPASMQSSLKAITADQLTFNITRREGELFPIDPYNAGLWVAGHIIAGSETEAFMTSCGDTFPDVITLGSPEVRLQCLAGVVDADSCVSGDCEYTVTVDPQHLDAIQFLVRSLGFVCAHSSSSPSSFSIVGPLHNIPTKLKTQSSVRGSPKSNHNHSHRYHTFTVSLLPTDSFFGFTLDGNSRFIIHRELIVTHNTHTLLGPVHGSRFRGDPGIIPQALQFIFAYGVEKVTLSYLEIYKEKLYDLLSPSRPLQLRQKGNEAVIPALSRMPATSIRKALNIVTAGSKNRTVAPTLLNINSSRSHTILAVHIPGGGVLNLVDLAGSERFERAASTGHLRHTSSGSSGSALAARQREGISINRSLLTLRQCLLSLARKRSYVPFRESKLTRVLRGPLEGGEVLLICTVMHSTFLENRRTLDYASVARRIQTRLVSQSPEKRLEKENSDLRREITQLKKEMNASTSGVGAMGGSAAAAANGSPPRIDPSSLRQAMKQYAPLYPFQTSSSLLSWKPLSDPPDEALKELARMRQEIASGERGRMFQQLVSEVDVGVAALLEAIDREQRVASQVGRLKLALSGGGLSPSEEINTQVRLRSVESEAATCAHHIAGLREAVSEVQRRAKEHAAMMLARSKRIGEESLDLKALLMVLGGSTTNAESSAAKAGNVEQSDVVPSSSSLTLTPTPLKLSRLPTLDVDQDDHPLTVDDLISKPNFESSIPTIEVSLELEDNGGNVKQHQRQTTPDKVKIMPLQQPSPVSIVAPPGTLSSLLLCQTRQKHTEDHLKTRIAKASARRMELNRKVGIVEAPRRVTALDQRLRELQEHHQALMTRLAM